MSRAENVFFIGCGVLGPDVNWIAKKLNLSFKRKLLPGGLHNYPDELRRRLQDAIDEAAQDKTCARIIVGYGLCGRGTVGIKAPRVPLIFPRVHDCIALFLGSNQAYKKEFANYPGTFYISTGWYAEKENPENDSSEQIWIGSRSVDCNDIKERYGEKGGQNIIRFFSSWQDNYQRVVFIDTGVGKAEQSIKHAKKMAEKYNWKYEKIKGDLSLITRLLTSIDSDDQILVVPPGHVTIYSSTKNGLASVATAEKTFTSDPQPRFLVVGAQKSSTSAIRYGLGIDAGGTYTDAVIYDFKHQSLVCKNKELTSKWDFSIGIDRALAKLDKKVLSKVELVSVSTTLATNAIVEGEGQKAALILMFGGGMVPDKLITHTPQALVKGGMSISGQEIEAIDPNEVRRIARQMVEKNGVTAFAVSGFAGAINPSHELEVKRIIQKETGMVVVCGHELSDLLDFAVRAQTAVLNARIIPRMVKFFRELDLVLKQKGIKAPVMVVKGDGTLMSATMAKNRPVETILSGPAASVAGAKLLTGLNNATVVDIGGTTTDTAQLIDGTVEVCEKGARVGGFVTHVKALDMRTVGLGGDSLICWHKKELLLGPKRVAPIAWAAFQSPACIDKALHFIETRLLTSPHAALSQIVLLALEGEFPFVPTKEETDIYTLLLKRPYSLEELAESFKMFSTQFLPTERLEESGLVQRCGLTPTDILHLRGSFKKWPIDAARRMVAVLARLTRIEPDVFMDSLLERFEKVLAEELLKKQFPRDINVDSEKETELSRHLMECILGQGNSRYSINARLKNPVIGIGAPVHYFLPAAGKILNAEIVIPANADVANALGAITGYIVINKKISIVVDQSGLFCVQGVKGNKQFDNIEKAEKWAIEYLKKSVREMGHTAGTSQKTVEIEIRDTVITANDETDLFLSRTISAKLSGSPDIS